MQRMTIQKTASLQKCFHCNRISDIEKKYYADGEDAFAMKRDLKVIAKQIEQERKERKKKALGHPIEEPLDENEVYVFCLLSFVLFNVWLYLWLFAGGKKR
jgi:hypothetical protein